MERGGRVMAVAASQRYGALFLLINLGALLYKGVRLPYPPTGVIGWELAFAFIYYPVENARLGAVTRGNKTEQAGPLILAGFLSLPVITFHLYYMLYQTYVLRLDQVINAISLALIAIQLGLGLISSIAFAQARLKL